VREKKRKRQKEKRSRRILESPFQGLEGTPPLMKEKKKKRKKPDQKTRKKELCSIDVEKKKLWPGGRSRPTLADGKKKKKGGEDLGKGRERGKKRSISRVSIRRMGPEGKKKELFLDLDKEKKRGGPSKRRG